VVQPKDRTDLAIDLATVVVKVACSFGLSAGGTLLGPLADFAAGKAKDRVQQRRMLRLLEECVDIVAEKLIDALSGEAEFRGLPDNEQQAAVLAVQGTFELANFDISRALRYDLDATQVQQAIRPAVSTVLSNALLSEGATELYGILLRESCAYIVEVMTSLPNFQASAIAELLRRDTQIRLDLRNAIARLPMPRDHDDFTVDYRRAVASKLDRMELLGVNINERASRRYPLSVAYISLRVLSVPTRHKTDRSTDLSRRQAITGQRVEDVLRDQKRFLLIGEAGSGKTTLLRWLAVKSARRTFDVPLRDWNQLIPFLIPMRRYTVGNFPSPAEFVGALNRNVAEGMPDGWIRSLLLDGKALVLIDGMDELPAGRPREAAHEWIEDLTNDFPSSTFVVTSRPAAVRDGLRMPNFRVAELQPMSIADINVFITRWHKALREELGDGEEYNTIPGDQRALLSTIEKDPHLRTLANNPLLCALLCALNRERRGDLPRQRAEVYRAALEMLLERRDKERGLRTLDSTSQTIVLQELAFWLLRQGKLDVPIQQAQQVIDRILSSLPARDEDSREILDHLLTRSGLIREPIRDRIDFIHRTFQDYLAGKAAVENDEIGLLIGNAGSDQWRDVIVMAAALSQPRQREELLRGLITESGRKKDETLNLLAVACLQNAPQLSPDLRSDIESIARNLLPPRSIQAAQSLAAAGDLVLDVLASRAPMNQEEVTASIRLAGMIGTDGALDLLSAIAQTHHGIEAELVQAWRLFDPMRYAKEVLGRADLQAEIFVTDMELLPYIAYLDTPGGLRVDGGEAMDLSSLGNRPVGLTSLSIYRRPRAKLNGIERWDGLERLELIFENTVPDLQPVAAVRSLKSLHIEVRHGISVRLDLSPLVTLRNLQEFSCLCDTRYQIYLVPIVGPAMKKIVVDSIAEIADEQEIVKRTDIRVIRRNSASRMKP
jgi:hypothetical protein